MSLRWWYRWRYRDSPYVGLYRKASDRRVIALDLETTGLDPERCRVLSLAAVPVEDRCICHSEALYLTVQDFGEIGIESMRHHRLRAIDLTHGVPLAEALRQCVQLMGSRPILGYCVEFDVAVLRRLVREHLRLPLCNARLELRDRFEQVWRRQHPEREPTLDLDSMLRALHVPPLSRHDAYADATSTAAAWLKLALPGALAANAGSRA